MIEHYFSRTSVLTRLRYGLLGPYLDELVTTLQQQGYARDSIRHYLRACDQFGQWLTHQGYAAQEVNEALVERYLSGLPRRPAGRQPQAAEGLPHLLRLLQKCAIIAPPPPSAATAEHPFNAGHRAPSMTCREGLTALPWHGQLADL